MMGKPILHGIEGNHKGKYILICNYPIHSKGTTFYSELDEHSKNGIYWNT